MLSTKNYKRPQNFALSFASHPKAVYWHKDNVYKPENLCISGECIAKFDCDCKHTFTAALFGVSLRNQWCPYCANFSKKFCDDTDCGACYEKSFASHEKAVHWSTKNEIEPNKVTKQSSKYFWFDCTECKHTFSIQLKCVYSGSWCCYCSKTYSKLCDISDCVHCTKRSFASSHRISYWNYGKNKKLPRNCALNLKEKFWFTCEYKHEFQMSLNNISSSNQFCPICINKTERKMYEWLTENYNGVQLNATFEWCRNANNNLSRYDFALREQKIIIEIDGRQHFEAVKHFAHDHYDNQENDKFKMLRALQNGYSIIRIYQYDVLNNTIDWEDIIEDLIEYRDHWSIMYVAKNPDQYQQYYIEDIPFIHCE